METLEKLVKANGIHWYGDVLKRDNDDVLKERWISKWLGE